MSKDIKAMYRKVMDDNFPGEITLTIGETRLTYAKQTWKIAASDGVVEKGLRYGENPGQEAALYRLVNGNLALAGVEYLGPEAAMVSAIDEAAMVQFGKHPSKTNLTDVDACLGILRYLAGRPTAVIVKHNNPCGVASAASLAQAYHKANMADRIAAFGGAAGFNRAVDKQAAELISANYLEVVAAPEFEEGTLEILTKKKDLRIIKIQNIERLEKLAAARYLDFKSLTDGGLIIQQSAVNPIRTRDDFLPARAEHEGRIYEPQRQPTAAEYEDLVFGWAVEQGVTSNSVLYVKDLATVGIGTGEQDRVGVAEIAIFKAYTKYADQLCWNRHQKPFKNLLLEVEKGQADPALTAEIEAEAKQAHGGLIGASMISDAFFPFRDGVDVAIKEGISAICHPGGSMRDWESIQAINEANPKVAMVFTGQRAFKH